jgi:CRISPR type III-A-associated RAMP protein Csm5
LGVIVTGTVIVKTSRISFFSRKEVVLWSFYNAGVTKGMGSGIGWISTTVGLILKENPHLLEEIRREFGLGRRRNQPYYVPEFPKTRKLIMDEEIPKYPLGWIRLVELP